jgi:hypothetical protein
VLVLDAVFGPHTAWSALHLVCEVEVDQHRGLSSGASALDSYSREYIDVVLAVAVANAAENSYHSISWTGDYTNLAVRIMY